MNEIMNISGIECFEKDGTAYLKLETVARGLGFIQIAKSGNGVVRWEQRDNRKPVSQSRGVENERGLRGMRPAQYFAAGYL